MKALYRYRGKKTAANLQRDPSGTFPLRRRFAEELKAVWNSSRLAFNYSASEARDALGRWTDGGASENPARDAATDYAQNGTRAKSFLNWFGDWTNPRAHADGTPARVWIAFEPHQVKSVANRGSFDASDKNIFNAVLATNLEAAGSCLDPRLWGKHLRAAYRQGLEKAYDVVHSGTRATVATNESAAALAGARGEFVTNACRFDAAATLRAVWNEYRQRGWHVLTARPTTNSRDAFLALGRLAVVRAHAEGQLDGYARLGIDRVRRAAEVDGCSRHDGAIYNLSRARGQIPAHVLCRCAWQPAANTARTPRPRDALEAFSELLANYDPSQPRDERGRWSADGGGGNAVAGQTLPSSKKAEAVPSSRELPPPATDVESRLRSGTPISKKALGGGANSSYIMEMDNGEKAVWKPRDGERTDLRDSIPEYTQYKREAAAYAVAKAIGMEDLIPPTTIREIDGKVGSMQEFTEGVVAKEVPAKICFDGDTDLKRAAVFDYLVGNSDRHRGNWLVDLKRGDKLRLIDHGLILPNNQKDTYVNQNIMNEATVRKNFTIPPEIAHLTEKWPAVEKALESCQIEPDAIAMTHHRLIDLTEAAARGKTFDDLPPLFPHLGRYASESFASAPSPSKKSLTLSSDEKGPMSVYRRLQELLMNLGVDFRERNRIDSMNPGLLNGENVSDINIPATIYDKHRKEFQAFFQKEAGK